MFGIVKIKMEKKHITQNINRGQPILTKTAIIRQTKRKAPNKRGKY